MQESTQATDGKLRQTIVLLAGDWLALALFIFLGQVNHDVASPARLLMQTVALGVPWTIAALALRAHEPPSGDALRGILGRSLLAWLVAAPFGLILRALVQGQATIVVAFMLVTMGVGGILLLGWRLFYFVTAARRTGA